MTIPMRLWYIDGESPVKRPVRLEILGKTFMLYEKEWRSGPYYFGDIVHRGSSGDTHVFGLEDGLKDRPKWELRIKGDIPAQLAALLPKHGKKGLGNIVMLIIAFLCLAIVYIVGT